MTVPRPVGKARIERVTWSPSRPWRWAVLDIDAHRVHVGYSRSWDAALFAVGLARDQVGSGKVPHPEPPRRENWAGGSCGRATCPCADPSRWPVCGEWMGLPGDLARGCPRCGWTRDEHPELVTPTGEAA